jgi:uncharacterized protein YxeA
MVQSFIITFILLLIITIFNFYYIFSNYIILTFTTNKESFCGNNNMGGGQQANEPCNKRSTLNCTDQGSYTKNGKKTGLRLNILVPEAEKLVN